jgi:hypothetical protein
MKKLHGVVVGSMLGVAASIIGASLGMGTAAQAPRVAIDGDDIGGQVLGQAGPEAGVWVIAETTNLPTKFSKSVVTDDQGRYLIPDLPDAQYKVWVRGYGLVDSPPSEGVPGSVVNLPAWPAKTPQEAAKYYPAIQWYSLLDVPAKSDFPGTGAGGNGINPNLKSQAMWVRQLKTDGCVT